MQNIPWVPVLVGGVIYFVLGMLWYSPALFGKMWMKELGVDQKKIDEMKEKGMTLTMLKGLVSAFVVTSVMAYLVYLTGISDVFEVVKLSVFVWLGFNVTTMFSGVLWENYSVRLFGIHTFFSLVGYVLIGIVLVSF